MRGLYAAVALGLVACSNNNFDPPSYVGGLRVLAIKAEPPEVAGGQPATVTALAVGGEGAVAVAWSECRALPLPGLVINNDCFTTDMSMASDLVALGNGATIPIVMPMVQASDLGQPDATGGVYLTLRADATTARESVTSGYRLRLAGQDAPNHNPQLVGMFRVPSGFDMGFALDGGVANGVVELDATQPPTVRAGEKITLRGLFSAGSAETYAVRGRRVTEVLTIAWFATAGTFITDVTGNGSNTVLTLDKHLPPPGSAIDVWIVGRDERGGADYMHRTLAFQ